MKTQRTQTIRDVLFLTAYTFWLSRSFFRTTYFGEMPVVVWIVENALYAVILLCFTAIALDFRFTAKEVAGMAVTTLMFWLAYSSGAKAIAVAVILVFAARNVSFRRIMQWSVGVISVWLAAVVGSSLLGVIDNAVFVQYGNRVRYALGFVYCSYASHYLLLIFMLYLVLRRRIRWYEVTGLLLLNMAGYWATDTKTDILSLLLMAVLTLVFRLLRNKKTVLKLCAYIGFLLPFGFWGLSYYTAAEFKAENPFWAKLNFALNQRLLFGQRALEEYPIRLLGQKIRWVGGSAMAKDSTLTYNYVDNNYLASMLQMGVVFTFIMCLAYGRAAYVAIQKQQFALAAAVIVFMVIGLINPEMRNLLYNTFLLVLMKPTDMFAGIESWKPRKDLGENM